MSNQALAAREEQDRKEAEARDKDNGWVKVFVAWIPMGIISFVVCGLMMLGMFWIEHGTLNIGIDITSPFAA